MKISRALLLALFAACTALCTALSQSPDEFAAVKSACGSPTSVRRSALRGQAAGAESLDVAYRSLDLQFYRDRKTGWALTGVFNRGHDEDLSRDALLSVMPCLKRVTFKVPQFAPPAPAPATDPPVAPAAPDEGNASDVMIYGLLFCVGIVVYLVHRARTWANRPEMLCMNCHSVRQPLQNSSKAWYCPVCTHGTPVPLDSPDARDYLAHRP